MTQHFLICFRIVLVGSKAKKFKSQNFNIIHPNTLRGIYSKFKIVKLFVGVILSSAIVCVCVWLVWMCEYDQSVRTKLHHFFGDGFSFYCLSNSSMFICCPVLLGNEWKQYAKVWSVPGSYCGVCDEWWFMLSYRFQSLTKTWGRLVEPGMGYDWAILVSLTKFVCVSVGLGSCSIAANSQT